MARLIKEYGLISEYEIDVDKDDFITQFGDVKEKIEIFLNNFLTDQSVVKFRICLDILMEKVLPPKETLETTFRSKLRMVQHYEINDALITKLQKIISSIEKFTQNGSGYRVKELQNSRILIVKIVPSF